MKNYLLMILGVAMLFVLILLQSKPLVKNGLSLKGQNIDDMGMQFASLIENQFLGENQTMAFGKKSNQNTYKSEK